MSSAPVRICNVSYLNSVPYRAVKQLSWVEYSECEPAEAARRLHEGECDLALIPLAEFIRSGDYVSFDLGLATPGVVESVLVVSTDSPSEIETLYLDSASQSAATLVRLLLPELGLNPRQFARLSAPEAVQRAAVRGSKAAALVIGNFALECRNQFPVVLDLGEYWQRATGLPFVFALWAFRSGGLNDQQYRELQQCFLQGLEDRIVHARAWAEGNGSDRDHATGYVRNSISYLIGEREQDAAQEFADRGRRAGLFPVCDIRLRIGRLKNIARRSVDAILSDAADGRRISIEEGVRLGAEASFADLALASDIRRRSLHSKQKVSYIVDRNINYTNVCNVYCRFCAFYRAPGKSGGYLLSRDEIAKKIEETIAAGGIQILLQGGLNPELDIEYYEELFRWIKSNYPINLHALSADEILHIATVSHLSVEETLRRLIAAGLGSLPGAGAEILVDRVRHRIARLKTKAEPWLDVHRTAHRLGITSTCTMMFGVQEGWEDRVLHLEKLRRVQDDTGGFTAFITWPFQDENTKLKRGDTSSPEYLRTQALCRLYLDNIPNIQSSWVTQGPSVGQVALFFGANDFGSVMLEENVVSAAGTVFHMDGPTIEAHIEQAGFRSWQRDVHYQPVSAQTPPR